MKAIISFDGVGMPYYEDNLAKIAEVNDDYRLTKASIEKEFGEDEPVYQYTYDGFYKLVPEPENPHDPNAISIRLDDIKIGYIAKTDTQKVRELMDKGLYYRVFVSGGHCKLIEDEELLERDDPIEVSVIFYEPEETAPEKPKNTKLVMIIAIVLLVMSVILLLASPVAGVIGALIAVGLIIYSRKK